MSETPQTLPSESPHAFDVHAFEIHERLDAHRHGSQLSDIILGGQDGLVNTLGVILGVAAATSDSRIVIAGGMAAAFAESVSMAAVAYTSRQADHALYESELQREHRHIHLVPALERKEIEQIYSKKGFSGPLLDQIVDTITADKDVWVAAMMSEELNLSPIDKGHAPRASLIVGTSAIVGSLIPLVPFFLLDIVPAMWSAILIAGLSLFVVGAYKAHLTVGRWHRSGIEMAIIGIASALVGYFIGLLFKVPTVP
jgi:VIT1/CCC1 family predicted Fe2+/Mn2+ transporter